MRWGATSPGRKTSSATREPVPREILAALLEGGTSKEIARRLFVTEATVKFHVHNILAKTGFRNRAELAAALAAVSSEED